MINPIDYEDERGSPSHDSQAEDWVTGPECCRTCEYFSFSFKYGEPVPELIEPNDRTKGKCRYLPPVALTDVEDGFFSDQPDTLGCGWCGKYERGEPCVLPKR